MMTPQKYPQNLHTPKNIHFSEPPPPQKKKKKKKKILKFKILNPKKWPEPTYVWKYQGALIYFIGQICAL